ncbi:MAG: hypothetical protein RR420_08500 [Anaerovoracaceae bacterium]
MKRIKKLLEQEMKERNCSIDWESVGFCMRRMYGLPIHGQTKKLIKEILNDEYCERFGEKIGWSIISEFGGISDEFIRKHSKKIIWIYVISYCSEEIIREFFFEILKVCREYIGYDDVLSYEFSGRLSNKLFFSEQFLRDFQKYLSFSYLSYDQLFTNSSIVEHKNQISWFRLFHNNYNMRNKIDESTLREVCDLFSERNWGYMCSSQSLSENFLIEFSDKIHWDNLNENTIMNLSKEFIMKFHDKLNLRYIKKEDAFDIFYYIIEKDASSIKRIIDSEIMPDQLIDLYAPLINDDNWGILSKYPNLSLEICEKFKEKLNWREISRYHEIDIDFMEFFQERLNWREISFRSLPEEFLRKFKKMLNWEYVCEFSKLSEKIMEDLSDYMNWKKVSYNQKISEGFIKKHIEKLDIIAISERRDTMSDNLIRLLQDEIGWEITLMRQDLSMEMLEEFIDKIKETKNGWQLIAQNQHLDDEFIERYKNEFQSAHAYISACHYKL